MLPHIFVYLFSFIGIWIGSGIAVASVERLSRGLRISSFALSFLVLGIFTSLSEFSVGISAIAKNDPEIYVGNLIGASIVIFMLIIPLLAIVNGSINISKEFQGFNLAAALVVIALPVIFAMDGRIGKTDSILTIALFLLLAVSVQSKRGLLENLPHIELHTIQFPRELLRMAFGVAIIFIASEAMVVQTIYFAEKLNISAFIISIILVALGTNLPELSFVARSFFTRNKQIAFGDYVGSAAFNSFLIGLLTVINGNSVTLSNNYLISLLFLVVGLLTFYYFARSKSSISRIEALVLLGLYALFLFTEIHVHKLIPPL